MNIVIIDDESDIGFILGFELKAQGHQPTVFQSATDAQHFFNENNSVDLVICDFQMPHMSGLDFFLWLKSKNYSKPFIILSGEPSMDVEMLLNHGVSEILFKPEDLKKIPAIVNKISQNSKT